MDCHFLLQGIFPTQGLNSGLPLCSQTLPSEPPGKSNARNLLLGRPWQTSGQVSQFLLQGAWGSIPGGGTKILHAKLCGPSQKKRKKERKKKYTLVISTYYKLLEILGGCYSDMDLAYPLSRLINGVWCLSFYSSLLYIDHKYNYP